MVCLVLCGFHFKVVEINPAFAGEDMGVEARRQLVENLAGFLRCSWVEAIVELSMHFKTVLIHAFWKDTRAFTIVKSAGGTFRSKDSFGHGSLGHPWRDASNAYPEVH